MIIGIGVDIIQVKRFEHWLNDQKLLERYFHPEELQTALSRKSGACLSLAARFAAKEAFGKALGNGLKDIVLKDIMVENKHNGQPVINLFETAKHAFEKSGAVKIHVSLAHEKDNAIAMIVLESI